MHPRKKHTVFLSRVSSEFKELTDRIRASDDAYPWLRLIDQEAPDGKPTPHSAPLTVHKLRDWIDDSDTVFHYVGLRTGATANVPVTADRPIEELLNATCYDTLESLRSYFESKLPNAPPDSVITYTMLEAILAIGLGKELLIFWLDPRPITAGAIENPTLDPVQQAYRDWLYQHHLSGRDRIRLDFPEDIIASSAQKLQALDRAVALEYRAHFAQNQNPVWEALALIADPNTPHDDAFRYWSEIRDRTASTAIDWVGDAKEISDPIHPHTLAPEPIFCQVPDSEAALRRDWLVPVPSKLHRLRIDRNEVHLDAWPSISGRSVRACCIAEQSVWVLCESERRYVLHRLDADGVSPGFTLNGFQTHGFHPIQLTFSEGNFYVTYQGQMWLVPCALETPEWAASRYSPNAQSTRQAASGVVEQLSLPRCFPFQRGFHGQTYDARISDDYKTTPWAVVKKRQQIFGITITSGCFLDLFKTVDVTFDEPFEEIRLQRFENGIIAWQIQPENRDAPLHIPLFFSGNASIRIWRCQATQTRIIRFALSVDQSERVCQVCPDAPGSFVPNCFIQHSKFDGNRSRFRVWLLPRQIDTPLAQQMLPFTQEFAPLPKPTVDSPSNVSLAEKIWSSNPSTWIDSLDPWYQTLWEHCKN